MSKKVGRPKSYTADYYPLYIEPTPELEYIENMYKEKGFTIYSKIMMLACKTYMHVIPYKTDYDIQTLRFYVGTEYELVDAIIKYLVDRDFINQEMFAEGKIWIPYLIRILSGLYSNRRHDPPQKVGKDIITTCSNTQLVSELDSELPSKVVIDTTNNNKSKSKESNSSVSKTIDELKEMYPNQDVDKSLKKLSIKNPNYNDGDVTRWLDDDVIKGYNLKPPKIKTTPSGMLKAKCLKCGDTDSLQDMRGFQTTHHCGGEYEPIYEEAVAKVA